MHVSNLSAQKAAQMIGKRLWLALMDAAEQSRHDSGWCSEPDRLGNKVKVGEQVHCGMMPITAPILALTRSTQERRRRATARRPASQQDVAQPGYRRTGHVRVV